MTRSLMAHARHTSTAAAWMALLIGGCGGGSSEAEPTAASASATAGPNAVAYWNEVAATTINQPAAAAGTPEERRPLLAVDLATVQLAIYDAVVAVSGSHLPYGKQPRAPSAGASAEAAAGAAAHGVLKGLFPGRGAFYEAAYERFVAALPDDAARGRGLALGAEVAAGLLALRADDGRWTAQPAYAPGASPGQFRGSGPINRVLPHVRPFVVASAAQFRAAPPPPLTSAAYAADVEETRTFGAAASTARSASQTEAARFHTEAPPLFWARNLRQFASAGPTLAEQARLTAMLWVAQADATITCFESKYHYDAWRPTSAITLADSDGNPGTTGDPAWTPVVPTPNHPEYPAAHSCVAGATAGVLRAFQGSDAMHFVFDSSVTGTSRSFASAGALVDDIALARIAGGMHFRYATTARTQLGEQVAAWVAKRAFARTGTATPDVRPCCGANPQPHGRETSAAPG